MSFWQWIMVLLIIAFVIYGIFYYVFLPTQVISPSPVGLITRDDPVKGTILADSNGKSLYIFDRDTLGVSNCIDTCLVNWPPFSANLATQDTLPENVSIINHPDGSSQFAWKGLPLYYYIQDVNIGDVLGDDFGGVWHLVQP